MRSTIMSIASQRIMPTRAPLPPLWRGIAPAHRLGDRDRTGDRWAFLACHGREVGVAALI
jgi:hypothetical protein